MSSYFFFCSFTLKSFEFLEFISVVNLKFLKRRHYKYKQQNNDALKRDTVEFLKI